MLEIKFRGRTFKNKDKADGIWVYGHPVCVDKQRNLWTMFCEDYSAFHVDPSTVCQYIGLKDKNGKEIYEGDLGKTYNGDLAELCFGEYQDDSIIGENSTFYFDCDDYERSSFGWYVKSLDGGRCIGVDNSMEKWFEVVGNRYDNPELLP